MRYPLFGAALGLFLFSSAAGAQPQKRELQMWTNPYYPLGVGNRWVYQVKVNDTPSEKATAEKVEVTVDQEEGYNYKPLSKDKKDPEPIPIKRFRLKTQSRSKVLYEHVAMLADGAYRFTSANKEITPPLQFLKLPLTKGEKWEIHTVSENVPINGIFSCDDDNVKVPAGSFQTKHVSAHDFQVGAEKMSLDYWFAPNIGLVKQHVRVGNSDVLMELEEFKAGK